MTTHPEPPAAADFIALAASSFHPARQVEPVKWSAGELLRAKFADPRWVIPELMPAGLIVLAGRPKLGKSWLALQMAVSVGSGGMFFNKPIQPGRVLYLALEDSRRRIQNRLRKQGATAATNVDFLFEFDYLSTAAGVGRLIDEVQGGGYALVVIDTISRALGKADQNDAGQMNVCFGLLQQAAVRHEIALLLIDHHRKSAGGDSGDVVDDVMSATSKTAVADAVLGLYRRRGERTATLKLAGRDVEENELAVTFDRSTCCWQYAGMKEEVTKSAVQDDILAVLKQHDGGATASQIAKLIGKDTANTWRELNELVNAGKIKRGQREGRDIPYLLVG